MAKEIPTVCQTGRDSSYGKLRLRPCNHRVNPPSAEAEQPAEALHYADALFATNVRHGQPGLLGDLPGHTTKTSKLHIAARRSAIGPISTYNSRYRIRYYSFFLTPLGAIIRSRPAISAQE